MSTTPRLATDADAANEAARALKASQTKRDENLKTAGAALMVFVLAEAVVPALLPEHADGTIWADIECDLWMPSPFGWATVHRTGFSITTSMASPGVQYGPYRAVLGPPQPAPIQEPPP